MKRYVDDVNMVAQIVPLGARYKDGRLVVKREKIESDILDPRSQRTGSYKIGAVIVNV